MQWYAIPWFGGVKVECQQCGRYTTEWTEQESRDLLYLTSSERCDTCTHERTHIEDQREIKKLKRSVEDWKDDWFRQREIIGRLSWEHNNCPHDVRPPQDPKPNPWLHQGERFVQLGKLVYAKQVTEYKLVGASTSEDGAKAIIRLMSMENSK